MRSMSQWMETRRLQLAGEKTEIVNVTIHHFPINSQIAMASNKIQVNETVRYPEAMIDKKLMGWEHIKKGSRQCLHHIKDIDG